MSLGCKDLHAPQHDVIHVFPVLCVIVVTRHNRTNTGKDDYHN